MVFREKIESIMAEANLSEDEKDLLLEVLVPKVLSYDALNAIDDGKIIEIVKKIKESQLYDDFYNLLEAKSQYVDNMPIDMINDGLSICG